MKSRFDLSALLCGISAAGFAGLAAGSHVLTVAVFMGLVFLFVTIRSSVELIVEAIARQKNK